MRKIPKKEGCPISHKFWQFRNQADGSGELLLYGDIAGEKSWFGDEVTPKEFAGELNALGAVSEITVRINSGGGDVFAAAEIGNLLEQHPAHVTARIGGVCASAATIIACHCDRVVAANDSTYMVHPVRMGLFGYADADTLRQYIDAITTIQENIVGLYARKTGRGADEVAGWMDATSWWTGPKAKEHGFVDELTHEDGAARVENRGGVLFVNSVSMGLPFHKAPEFVREMLADGSAAGQSANTSPAGEPEHMKEEHHMDIKTVDDLRKAYPALADQIELAGAEAERARIRSIEDMALPGSEALTAEAKFTNPMNTEDFAKELVKNAKAQGAAYLAAVERDAEKSGANSVINAPTDGQGSGDEFLAAIKALGKQQ